MKITRMMILSMVFCAVSMACYYGYDLMNRFTADTTYPVIEIRDEELVISIDDGREALFEGVTAYDEKDGDITDSIVIESISHFVDEKRTVTYAAFDGDNHVSKATRVISYEDYEAPVFSCTEGYRFPVGSKSLTDNMEAEDCIDGNLTGAVKVTRGFYVDTANTGLYNFQYQVTNSAGDVEYLPVTVEIYDPSDSTVLHIELKQYVVYTTVGKKIDARSYLKEGMENVSVDTSEVDYDTPGTYEIVFSGKDGNREGTNRMAVVVR